MAIRALETGHHVVIEKPMATSVHDAEMILHTSKKYHRQVFCVMQNRYSPPSLWLKQIVDSGLLGQIYIVQLNCYWNRDQRYYQPPTWHGDPILDGGTLFTQFSHFIDILYWVFGDILPFHARFSNFNHPYLPASSPAAIPSPAVTSPLFEDSGIVSFNFLNSPAIGTFSYSTSVWDKNMESSLLVIAQNGSLKIGGQYMNQVDYCHIKDYQLPPLPPTNPGNDYGPYKGSAQNHHHVIRHVIQTLSPTTHTTLSPQSDSGAAGPLEGLKVVDIIHRIYRLKN
jgi:predicted dehydrogenase